MNQSNVLWGFVDSDWARCPESRRSTTGFMLMLNGAAVAWKSKRQSVEALSSAEAEFIAASALVQEVIYTRRLLENLGFPQKEPTLSMRTIVHALLGQRDLWVEVIVLNISTSESIFCMTLWSLRFSRACQQC